MNNRQQNGRRRGRGGMRPQNGAPRGDGGSRIDNRARGNATQLHDKYKALARDAQMQGDRVLTEYYFQFADHYFRILMEQRPRTEDGQQRQNGSGRYDMADGMEGEEGSPDEMFGDEPRRYEARRDQQPRDDQRNGGDQRNGNRQDYRREGREDGYRDDRQDDGQRQERRDDGRRDFQRESARRDESRREPNGYRADERLSAPQPEAPAAPPPIEAFAPAADDVPEEPIRRRRGRPRRSETAEGASEGERIEADRLPPAVRIEAAPANDTAEPAPAPRRRGRPPRARPDEGAVAEA